jgi:hypothetical protein
MRSFFHYEALSPITEEFLQRDSSKTRKATTRDQAGQPGQRVARRRLMKYCAEYLQQKNTKGPRHRDEALLLFPFPSA